MVQHSQFAWFGIKAFDGVEADFDANRDKSSERAVYPSAQRNPFVWRPCVRPAAAYHYSES
jgi:hypothetical protein